MSIIKRFREWRERRRAASREKRLIEAHGCICYCPSCKDPLNDQAAMTKAGVWDNIVGYRCSECDNESMWNFNFPVPLLVGYAWDKDGKLNRDIEATRVRMAKEATDGK